MKNDIDYELLNLRWEEEIAFYVAQNRYRIIKNKVPSTKEGEDDQFEYVIVDRHSQIILTIVSPRNVLFSPKKRRKRRKKI